MNDNPTDSKAVLKLWQGFCLQKIPAAAAITTVKDFHELKKIIKILSGEETAFIKAGEKKAFRELIKSVTDKLHAAAIIEGKKYGLPAGVFRAEGQGGDRAFIPHRFTDAPLCVFEKPSQATSAQIEFNFPSGETGVQEVYTIRNNKKLALTGRQENILFTLLNDEFLHLTGGPAGAGVIEGTIEKVIEKTGGRVRLADMIDDLRAIAETRFDIRDATQKTDGVNYAIRGPLFTLDIMPTPGSAKAIEVAPRGKHPFRIIINERVTLEILMGLFQRIELTKFWAISKPRDRHVYAYLVRNRTSVPVRVATFCRANGFTIPASRQGKFKTRQAIRKSLEAVSLATGDFTRHPGSKDWFVDPRRIGWVPATAGLPSLPATPGETQSLLVPSVLKVCKFAAPVPDDILAAYRRHGKKHGIDVEPIVRRIRVKLQAAYAEGALPEYERGCAAYRVSVLGW